jgi:hypothetical protein
MKQTEIILYLITFVGFVLFGLGAYLVIVSRKDYTGVIPDWVKTHITKQCFEPVSWASIVLGGSLAAFGFYSLKKGIHYPSHSSDHNFGFRFY